MSNPNHRHYYKHNRLQQLKGFCYAVQTGSISRAAERMFLSQPSVSLQIQALEKELNVTLFERRGPRIRLTPEGQTLYELSLPLLEGLDTLAREVRVRKFGGGSHDVVALARDGELAAGVILKIRDGTMLGRDTQRFSGIHDEDDPALLSVLATRYYLGGGATRVAELPREILFPFDFDDRETLEEVLGDEAGRKVATRVPRRGEKKRLVDLADDKARHVLERSVRHI
jgi:DNA-binding MarR family transcriptional regulator